jgi:CHAT domain-containing protein
VQALLDADTTLLSYYVTAGKTLAFVVTQRGFQTVELSVGERPLRDAANRLRAFAQPDLAAPALEELAGRFLVPLADRITTPVVGIIPHGVLHYVPFGALSDGPGYFGERHALFHLPSASTLPFVQQKRKGRADRVLAMAESRPLCSWPLSTATCGPG